MNSRVIIEAACKTKGVDPAMVEQVDLVGDDLFLHLADGSQVRVELSALPAELFAEPETDQLTEPTPEHTTLTEPAPSRAKAQAKKKGRK